MASDILIVDDEADIRELVAGILRTRATTPARPHDADEALAAIADARARAWSSSTSGCRAAGSTAWQLLDEIKAHASRTCRW